MSLALGGGTTRMSGTSMASPDTVGVVALLLEKSRTLTPSDVKSRIAAGSYTFDGTREGILYARAAFGL